MKKAVPGLGAVFHHRGGDVAPLRHEAPSANTAIPLDVALVAVDLLAWGQLGGPDRCGIPLGSSVSAASSPGGDCVLSFSLALALPEL
jgi:hypothetical protein